MAISDTVPLGLAPQEPVAAGLKDLLRTSDLTAADVTGLLDTAATFKARHYWAPGLLAGELVVIYLTTPCTRTRLSFSAAAARLGAFPVVVGPAVSEPTRRETVEDTARSVSGYAAVVVVRTEADADVARLARTATIPVVSGMTDGHHPCQSLADLLTLREHFGQLSGLRLAYLGDGTNVAHSLMEAGALAGMEVTVATPPGYEPDPEIVARAQSLASVNGGAVRTTYDPQAAVDGVDAVYTDAWVSPGRPGPESESELGRRRRRIALLPYQVNAATMDRAASHAVFLHRLPAHRDDEVTADVIGGPRSLVFTQAENRLHAATAVISALTRRTLVGAHAAAA
jgi:ornithine carbamoyltransferase